MFVETKREGEAAIKPSFKGFVAWLEQRRPDEKYVWGDCRTCAIAQYLHTFGFDDINQVSYSVYVELEGETDDHIGDVAMNTPHTFGAALERARARLAVSGGKG